MKTVNKLSVFIQSVFLLISFILKLTFSVVLCGIPLVLLIEWCFPDYVHILNKEITDKTIINLIENKKFDEAIWLIDKKENSINSFSRNTYFKIKSYEIEAQMAVGNFKAAESCIEKVDSITCILNRIDNKTHSFPLFSDIQKARLYFKMNDHARVQKLCKKYYYSSNRYEKKYIDLLSEGDYSEDEVKELAKAIIDQLKIIYIRSVASTDYNKGRELFRHEISISRNNPRRKLDLYLNYSINALKVDSIDDIREGYSYIKSIVEKKEDYLYTPNFLLNYITLSSYLNDSLNMNKVLSSVEDGIKANYSTQELGYYEMMSKCIPFWDSEGDYDKSINALKRQSEFFRNMIHRNFLFYGEGQRENIYYLYKSALESSFTHLQFDSSPKAAKIAYDNALFIKGLLLRSSEQILNAVVGSNNQSIISLYNDLISMKKELVEYQVLGGIINKYRISKLKSKIEKTEQQLSNACYKYRILSEQQNFSYDETRAKLDKNEACIEFIMDEKGYYYALIGRSGFKYPRVVKLFSSDYMQEKFDEDIYKNSEFSEKMLGNIIPYLNGITTIYYSPVGELYKISFDALLYNKKYLLDNYNLIRVSSTSDIKNDMEYSYKTATIMGNIRYSATDSLIIAHAESSIRSAEHNNYLLPLGNEEIFDVCEMLEGKGLKVHLYTRLDASEEMLKSLSGKSTDIIHLSTHGFYDPSYSSYPMRNSGVFLAGANRKWYYNSEVKTKEDGILTADEISLLNLSGCSLVALSACETGLGNIDNNEGVFGLQRAFKLAGVQSLILSLWKVDTEATSLFMTNFYKEWVISNNMSESFRKAKLIVRKEFPDPYYWSGFVLVDALN